MRRSGRGVSQGQLVLPLFVKGLEAGARESLPPPVELRRMAEAVLARVPGHGLSADDLVSELTVRLCERARRGEAPLGEGVADVASVLRHRLWQIATEHAPSRKVLKELAAHVRAALRRPLPTNASRPETLMKGDRFQARAIAQAVAWAVGMLDAPGEPRALARLLAREYGLLSEPAPLEEAIAFPAAAPPASGAIRFAHRLAARLGHENLALLRLRLDGATFEELGERIGGSTTRAFERFREIQAELSDEVATRAVSPPQVREALRLIAHAPE